MMRFDRDAAQKRWRLTSAGKTVGGLEYLNLLIWALVFIATSIITIGTDDFNAIAPCMAVGMVVSTMIVRRARGGR